MVQVAKKLAYWVVEKYAFMKMILIFLILLFPVMLRVLRIIFKRRYINKTLKKNITVGFFHPNCNAGTPQENVLWSAVKAVQSEYDNVQICIYTGDWNTEPEDILKSVESKFNIKLQPNIKFAYMRQRKWIKSFAYLGSMWAGCEALTLLKPHIMIDTMGYGFINPIFKYIGGCKVVNYIHNPMVTVDKLKARYVILNNKQYVLTRRSASSLGISRGIASIYGWTGRAADVVMVNSAYTEENINAIWKCPKRTRIVHPPIGLEKLIAKTDSSWDKKIEYRVVNASEFNYENNHELILEAFSKSRLVCKKNIMDEVHLVLINLATEPEDTYLKKLKEWIKKYDLEDYVKVHPLCLHPNRLEEELIKASYGIYAKADDHFGSDLIAGLSTGQIMICHASGAAKNELIDTGEDRNGYLAKTTDEYTKALKAALHLSPNNKRKIQKAARGTAEQFSRIYFQKEFLKTLESFFKSKKM